MQELIETFNNLKPSIPYILNGVWVTLQIAFFSALFGFILGIILAIFKISKYKVLSGFAHFYTSIFRGTPLIMQLSLVYLALPQLFHFDIEPLTAAILTFSLNSAAYMSEIIRSGLNAVDKGQYEAAKALGVPYNKFMLHIILPQAIKNILPALMNEFITLTKESAIVSTIAVTDLMRRSEIVAANMYTYFPPMIVAFIVYYCLTMILTFIGSLLERRLGRSD